MPISPAWALVTSCNTVLQTILDGDKRGQDMNFFTEAFMGVAPFGNLGAGLMTAIICPRGTLLPGSAWHPVGAAFFHDISSHQRESAPIYLRMCVILEVANGMKTAAEQPPLPENHASEK